MFTDGTRLADLLHDGRALLVDLTDDAGLRAHAEGYGERVRVVTAACPGGPEPAGQLVRPDGIVAWAAGAGDGVADALSRWFGPGRYDG
ncbi:hypothetical protein [Streptomyces sp. NPDC085540]|uniref:aromatic-ring hydroxylase C-terminal domain-containing protein n=1 Tax=Streptomyces sp. NPDC085540 TaxID=3365730 RepID=UPI0037CD2659